MKTLLVVCVIFEELMLTDKGNLITYKYVFVIIKKGEIVKL